VRAREFSVTSTVRFTLKGVPGIPSNEQTTHVRRDLVVDPLQVLGSEQEERRLRQEMEQELAQMVVLRLRLLEQNAKE
jgi:outer membrane lipopolysaccharide assembly protein LptE/RlpB